MEGPEGTRLASQAFEAINEAVRSAAGDTLPLVAQLIPLTLQKLNGTLAMAAAAPDARERQSEMQARRPRPRPMQCPAWSPELSVPPGCATLRLLRHWQPHDAGTLLTHPRAWPGARRACCAACCRSSCSG